MNLNKNTLKQEIDDLYPQTVQWRRHFHQHAELSFEEVETTRYLKERLEELDGVTLSQPTKTGIVARIKGGKPGRTVAIRADIDALPMTEVNDLPFVSENPKAMHACGHDGHAAILLTVATLASRHRAELSGELVCIFQHAEEVPPGGAIELYEAGVMEGVDEIYGCHLSSAFPTGTFEVRPGYLTSATDRFDIKVIGKGGHSAMPELCVDPILTGSQIVTALQSVVSRRIRAVDTAVLSVCQVSSGDAYNIIPTEMTITGSLRTFSDTLREQIPQWMEQISKGICDSAGATCECTVERGYASVINDPALTEIVEKTLTDWYGPEAVLHIDPVMPGEDFSAFTQNCPGCFVEIGTADPEKGTTMPHHNPAYLMDEEGLRNGVGLLMSIVSERLGGN